jgi:glyoxylase-like metal-dependent hydrolase (beta-lactamase superfamily II)
MKIHMNTGGLAATNCYLLLDESTHMGALIDAPRDTIAPLLALATQQGFDLPFLLLTHGHWDHIGDHAVYTKHFPHGKILAHRDAEPFLQAPRSTSMPLPYTIPGRNADALIADEQIITVGSIKLQALHTPGHAPGHIAFCCADHGQLVVGDLLFAGAVGRWDLPESNEEQLRDSLTRIMTLPDPTRVLSGHGNATTIGTERRSNPVLKHLGLI